MQPSILAPVIYSAADVNVIPLVKDGYRTALPSKIATCMACGKPIICCANGETARVIRNAGCGLVAEAEKPDLLAQKIIECSEMKQEDLGAMGTRGFEYSKEHYDMNTVFKCIENVLEGMSYAK